MLVIPNYLNIAIFRYKNSNCMKTDWSNAYKHLLLLLHGTQWQTERGWMALKVFISYDQSPGSMSNSIIGFLWSFI